MKETTKIPENGNSISQRFQKDIVRRLPGMRDFEEGSLYFRKNIQNALTQILASHGYHLVETPLMEPTEIFLRKSGGELASRMYTFLEPGGRRASLRPEFTSAIIRNYLEQLQNQSFTKIEGSPIRLQYAGPVFRYEPENPDVPREFVQVGAELIGATGSRAEAEIMALSCEALKAQGLNGLQLIIGNLGVVHSLLRQFQLSERALLFLMESLTDLREGQLGLQRVQNRAELLKLYSRNVLEAGNLDLENSVPEPPVGVRTRDEIVARLRRKQRAGDVSGRLENALQFVAKTARIKGAPRNALTEMKRLAAEFDLDSSVLKPLEETMKILTLHGLDEVDIILDLGLAPGIAYYTGIVFDLRAATSNGSISIGGGGRYDGLARALGAVEEVPALGFAWNLDRIVEKLEPLTSEMPGIRRVLVTADEPSAYGMALRKAASLRLEGYQAELLLDEKLNIDAKDYARAQGLEIIVTVDKDGTVTNTTL